MDKCMIVTLSFPSEQIFEFNYRTSVPLHRSVTSHQNHPNSILQFCNCNIQIFSLHLQITVFSFIDCTLNIYKQYNYFIKKMLCKLNYVYSGLTCTEQNFISKSGFQQYASQHNVIVVAPDTSPSK